MGYNWKPLPVQPIQVTTPSWLIHLCPAGGRGKLVVKQWTADHWVMVAKHEGELAEINKLFHAELLTRGIII